MGWLSRHSMVPRIETGRELYLRRQFEEVASECRGRITAKEDRRKPKASSLFDWHASRSNLTESAGKPSVHSSDEVTTVGNYPKRCPLLPDGARWHFRTLASCHRASGDSASADPTVVLSASCSLFLARHSERFRLWSRHRGGGN